MSRRTLLGLLFVCCVCCVAQCPLFASVPITDLPPELETAYDVVWTVHRSPRATPPVIVDVELSRGRGYVLKLDATELVWGTKNGEIIQPLKRVSMATLPGKSYAFSLKRRAGTLALLCDHRLLFTWPMPLPAHGTIAFRSQPIPGASVTDARYIRVDHRFFGDDFMRPEALNRLLDGFGRWVEDDIWEVAEYHGDFPGRRSVPTAQPAQTNPWQLSLYPVAETSTNGFWYLYTGTGPSWVVANETMVPPTWDRYFVQVAVRPDYDSEVGVMAAYQDNRNYLMFRWRPRLYHGTAPNRAALVAVIDGKEQILAQSARGFDPEQWATLRINIGWQRVQACVDGAVLLDAANPGTMEGRIGLYALGAEHPQRPMLDDATASMFVYTDKTTGNVVNDAADALRASSYILFDDVRVGDWESIDDLPTTPYATTQTGSWARQPDGTLIARTPGRWVTATPAGTQAAMTTRVLLPSNGRAAVIFGETVTHPGYMWSVSSTQQVLRAGTRADDGRVVDQTSHGIPSGRWTSLRIEQNGPYAACYVNEVRVLQIYDAKLCVGQVGLLAGTAGVKFQDFHLTPIPERWRTLRVHEGFEQDKWLITWASPEADWVPAFTPSITTTPLGTGREQIGPAAPYSTSLTGLYWHKGGHFGDFQLTLPLTPTMIAGQTLSLSPMTVEGAGYQWTFLHEAHGDRLCFQRAGTPIATYALSLTPHTQFQLERLGAYLIGTIQELDPTPSFDGPEIARETPLFVYRDPQPLQASDVGFRVTRPSLPAAAIRIVAPRLQETFEDAPVCWTTQSGIWKVMARYSCQPKWNWFGGFGAGTPTVWCKYRLDGDQDVEAYLGVKMQYDNMTEGEASRFRDFNMTICSDGAHVNQGYTVIRAGRWHGQPTTLLLKNGIVVATSTAPHDLLPTTTGHRQWFVTRIEKRGHDIRVLLDNQLAMTYHDPEPLSGGYAAIWSLNNGIMIGRANLAAERMSLGAPQAATPLAIQADVPSVPMPVVTVNGTPLRAATFEDGLDGWQARAGLTARLTRVREGDPQGHDNTYLAMVNTYPAGDCSVNLPPVPDLTGTPWWHADYCFDPGTRVNLYAKIRECWYEIRLTAPPAGGTVLTAGALSVQADGQWHHLDADLGALLQKASAEHDTLSVTSPLAIDELVVAEWSTEPDLRAYGCGMNPGGTTLKFDNVVWTPRLTAPIEISWSDPNQQHVWEVGTDVLPMTTVGQVTTTPSLTLQHVVPGTSVHLRSQTSTGGWGGWLHLPLTLGPSSPDPRAH